MGRFFFLMSRETPSASAAVTRVEDIRLRDVVEFIQTFPPELRAPKLLDYVRGYQEQGKDNMIRVLIDKLRNANLAHLADAVATYVGRKD